ncbi:MAG: hypothetical protein ACJAXM_000379 [Arenicella sp.]|jgi:hypothetical protein
MFKPCFIVGLGITGDYKGVARELLIDFRKGCTAS